MGDSYTIGEGVSEDQRWPNQLIDSLNARAITTGNTKIIARTGWTTTNLLSAMSSEDLEGYNLVSLLIGVNNQFQGLPFSVFEVEFDSLLQKSINIAGDTDRVFVVSIPDYGVTPFGSPNAQRIAEEIDAYNEYISQRCSIANIPYIDVTSISRQLGDSEAALATDRLHPSGTQYTAWVTEMLPSIIQLLQ